MNNKGFAITGILYTLFILFLLISVTLLGALSTKKNMSQQSINNLEKSFQGKIYTPDEQNITQAPVDGKYIFTVQFEADSEDENTTVPTNYTCYTYLKKKTDISLDSLNSEAITLIPQDCNNYRIASVTLDKIYSFEQE